MSNGFDEREGEEVRGGKTSLFRGSVSSFLGMKKEKRDKGGCCWRSRARHGENKDGQVDKL